MRKFEEFDFIIRKAHKGDLDQLVELGARFYQESNFLGNLTMSKNNYRATIAPYLGMDYVAPIVAVRAGQILGYLHIYAQRDYTVELVGEVYQFYVLPEYRSSGVSRALVEAANLQYAEWKVARGYVEAAPGMGAEEHLKLFENLWGRFGYKKIGIVMMKEFTDGSKSTESPGGPGSEPGKP